MIRRINLILATALAFSALVVAQPATETTSDSAPVTDKGNTWMQWRGPTRDGRFYGPQWPADFSSLKELWRVPLGESYSGPIVTDTHVITTETKDRKYEVVHAVDRKTGEIAWSREWQGAMKVPFFAARNGSWIRSTPASDGTSVYVGGIREVLVALDAKTGQERWKIDFVDQFGTSLPKFGFVCSPMIDGEFVYVQAAAGFVKIHGDSGKVVWRTAVDGGGMFGSAFSSPVTGEINGREMLLVQTRNSLKGIDAESGEELCSRDIKAYRGMNILTPTVFKNAVFTSAHSGQGELLKFASAEDGFDIEPAWENRKLEAYMSSPVVIDDFGYMLLKSNRFACFYLPTGKEQWRSNRAFGGYWSMVTQGNRILALDERGDLMIIRANPEKLDI
ncbi:MAG: PQQ-binding-like beta-propeller repeat protein, partial [Planctomycetota bacterium]